MLFETKHLVGYFAVFYEQYEQNADQYNNDADEFFWYLSIKRLIIL